MKKKKRGYEHCFTCDVTELASWLREIDLKFIVRLTKPGMEKIGALSLVEWNFGRIVDG
jgi:hypothetical protein